MSASIPRLSHADLLAATLDRSRRIVARAQAEGERLSIGEALGFTRADVERCRQRAHVLRYGTPWAPKVESMQPSAAELEEAREWDALAAKLAALLPPEEDE